MYAQQLVFKSILNAACRIFQKAPRRGNVLPNVVVRIVFEIVLSVFLSPPPLKKGVGSAAVYIQPLEITRSQQLFQIKLAGILLDFDVMLAAFYKRKKKRRGEDSKSQKIATRR